ncbi:MAG: CRISPR-associated endonuclease Cas3'', partial [Gemmatimonadales bacterium]
MGDAPYWYAHSRPGSPESTWEPLEDHLAAVAARAAKFGAAFDSGQWAALAGWWHDIGKFRPEFQRRLRGSREQVEHAGAGAALAHSRDVVPVAFAIAGHHAGLANFQAQGDTRQLALRERVQANTDVLNELLPLLPAALRNQPTPSPPPFLAGRDRDGARRGWEFWIRMLFSALVDADYLATEAFYTPERETQRPVRSDMSGLRVRLDERVARFSPNTTVDRLRAQVLADCRAAAAYAPGIFSLSVPTGGGKTLSAMAFALEHAERHGMRRVIMAVPYTSIIEQNAKVLRDALGHSRVIEQHSNLDESGLLEQFGEAEVRRRLAAENWDAEVVVTTNVQLFESLFANRPSRCRKLHNIARSIIVLDEAQAVPTGFLLPVLDALRTLSRDYGCTVVLATATQPALSCRDSLPQGLEGVREIASDPPALARSLRRVRVEWPQGSDPVAYEQIAGELAGERRVLAVVHRRRDARELARMLPAEGLYHLSALMCAKHRAEILDRIRD